MRLCVLIAVQETPQASTAFTPFELLFRWRSWDLLDIAREVQVFPYCSTLKFVWEMQKGINRVTPIVPEHMLTTQENREVHVQ